MQQTTTQEIIDLINNYKTKRISDFALTIQLPGEQANSRALLQDAINDCLNRIFPEQNIVCLKEKIFTAYIDKLKMTNYSAILFCRIKNK